MNIGIHNVKSVTVETKSHLGYRDGKKFHVKSIEIEDEKGNSHTLNLFSNDVIELVNVVEG